MKKGDELMQCPPQKGGAGTSHAPNPNILLSSQTTTAVRVPLQAGEANVDNSPLVCSAQNWCEHANTRIEYLASGPHHAKEICTDCGRVLRWLPKPATLERQELNAFRLVKLAMRRDLTHWERNFVRS